MDMPKKFTISIEGSKSVGKKSLAVRFVYGEALNDKNWDKTLKKCMEIKNVKYEITLDKGVDHPLEIHGYMILYSVTSPESFEAVDYIFEKINRNNIRAPMILVGTKVDLHSIRKVSTEQGFKKATAYNCSFLEFSTNVESDVCNAFVKLILLIDNTAPVEERLTCMERNMEYVIAETKSLRTEFDGFKELLTTIGKNVEIIKESVGLSANCQAKT